MVAPGVGGPDDKKGLITHRSCHHHYHNLAPVDVVRILYSFYKKRLTWVASSAGEGDVDVFPATIDVSRPSQRLSNALLCSGVHEPDVKELVDNGKLIHHQQQQQLMYSSFNQAPKSKGKRTTTTTTTNNNNNNKQQQQQATLTATNNNNNNKQQQKQTTISHASRLKVRTSSDDPTLIVVEENAIVVPSY